MIETGGDKEDGRLRYRAFISYRHADRAWGDWLHRSLESYRVPPDLVGTPTPHGPVPQRLGRIFRDREELAAAPGLGDRLMAALEASENLIVICTPQAAKSHWVNEEIKAWKRLGRADRVFAIVAGGEPNSTDPDRECFPPALKYVLDQNGESSGILAEPMAADARDAGDGRDNAKLKLTAGLLAVDYDKLRRREAEAQRRAFRRFAALAATLILVFAGLAAAAGWFAWQTRVENQRAEIAIEAARSSAERLTAGLAERLEGTEGAQASMIQQILEEALGLLNSLSGVSTNSATYVATQIDANVRLAYSKKTTGQLVEALAAAQRAVALSEERNAAQPGDDAQRQLFEAFRVEAAVLLDMRETDRALARFRNALSIAQAFHVRSPASTYARKLLATALNELGTAGERIGDVAAAKAGYLQAADILAALAPDTPEDWEIQDLYVFNAMQLAELSVADGQLDEAQATMERVIPASDRIAAALPDHPIYLQHRGMILDALGNLALERRDFPTAERYMSQSLAVTERLIAADPSDYELQRDLFVCYANMMLIAEGRGERPSARIWARRAHGVIAALVAHDPTNKQWSSDLTDIETFEGELAEAR